MKEIEVKKKIILYHTTTADKAANIMAIGFRDHATKNRRLTATYNYPPGVWLGDVPAIDDELFDGVGLFGFDAERQVFIAVDANLPHPGVDASDVDDTWPGTQYWAKATVWNQFPKTLVSLDDVIKLRLATDPKLSDMREWLDYERDYQVAFFERVKRHCLRGPR